jgi:hypothetical protein
MRCNQSKRVRTDRGLDEAARPADAGSTGLWMVGAAREPLALNKDHPP